MKKSNFLLFIFIVLAVVACKDDDDISYKTHEVDFYSTHKEFVIKPVVFDTIADIFLAKEAHLEGATFETVTEQVLIKEGYIRYRLMDSMNIQIVTDEERNVVSEIVCYDFFGNSEMTQFQVPAEYKTIVRERVIQQGTGAEVVAEYDTIFRRVIDTPSELIPNTDEQAFKRITFKIPEKRTIRGHLDYYFEREAIENCKEGNSYSIND